MLATAAVYDTRKKDERLSQWDQAIEEVRSGKDLATISTPDQISIGKAADESSNIMGNEVGEYTPDANICRKLEESATTVRQLTSYLPVPILEASKSPPRPGESMRPVWDELRDLVSESVKVSGNQIYVYQANLHHKDPEVTSAVAVESDRRLREGSEFFASTMSHWEPRTTYQLDRLARDVNGLVHELWQATSMSQMGITKRQVETDPENLETMQVTELLVPMLDGTTPAPDYPKVGTVGSNTDATSLNATLDSITRTDGLQEGNYDLMIAKICYNLLTSTSVPNAGTYEVLIRAFMKLQKPDLAELVVNRFKDTKLRPDEGILSAILVHYGLADDPEKFYTTIRQMAGLEDGLGLEKHHIFDLTKPRIQQWALDRNVIHRCGYLQEKANRNSNIYESLIRGCMNFHNLDGALRYLKTAIKEGCYVRTHLFADLVYYSLCCPERTGALLRIVTAISWQFGKRAKPGGGLDYNSDVRGKIYDVLEACGLGSALSGAIDAAEAVLNVQHPLARYIYPEQFAAMIRHFHEEEAKDMESYRAQRVPLLDPSVLDPSWTQHDGNVSWTPVEIVPEEYRRTEIEKIPRGFGSILMADTPSFVKISKLVGDGGDEAEEGAYIMPTPSSVVDESNFRAMAASSSRIGTLGKEYAEEGPLAGCF